MSLHLLRSKKQVPAWTGLTGSKSVPFTTVESFQTPADPTQQAPLLLSNSSSTNLAGLLPYLPLPICSPKEHKLKCSLGPISPTVLTNPTLFSQVSVSLKFWLTTQKDGTERSTTRFQLITVPVLSFVYLKKDAWIKKAQSISINYRFYCFLCTLKYPI